MVLSSAPSADSALTMPGLAQHLFSQALVCRDCEAKKLRGVQSKNLRRLGVV
jgi:hypothetical protein